MIYIDTKENEAPHTLPDCQKQAFVKYYLMDLDNESLKIIYTALLGKAATMYIKPIAIENTKAYQRYKSEKEKTDQLLKIIAPYLNI